MPVAFVHKQRAIGLVGPAAFDEHAWIRSQSHGSTQVRDIVLVVQHANDRMPAVAIDLRGIGVFQPHYVPSKLDESALKAEADAEIRDVALAGIAHGFDLAGDAAIVK